MTRTLWPTTVKSTRLIWGGLHLWLVCWLFSTVAETQQQQFSAQKIVFLYRNGDDLEQLNKLGGTLQAHLREFSMDIRFLSMPGAFSNSLDPITLAATVPEIPKPMAVIWFDQAQEKLTVVLQSAENSAAQVLERHFPTEEGNWTANCDAIASAIRSMVAPRLTTPAAPPPKPVSRESQPPPAAVKTTPPRSSHLFVQAGYTPVFASARDRYVQHGIQFGAGFFIGRNWELSAGVDLLGPLTAEDPYEDIRLIRRTIRLKFAGFFVFEPVQLGGSISVVGDISGVNGLETEQWEESTQRFNPGLSPSLFTRLELFRFLDLFFEIGFDFYLKNFNYQYVLPSGDEVTLIRTARDQPRGVVGFAIKF